MVEQGSEEEIWCKEKHLENHNFTTDQARDQQQRVGRAGYVGDRAAEGDGGTSCFIQGEDVRVVVVEVKQGRIADWKGGVKDWSLVSDAEEEDQRGRHRGVNGIS